MKKRIDLISRYGDKYYLEQIKGSKTDYKLELGENSPYLRVGFSEEDSNIYEFVDPPGGPFLRAGIVIDKVPIKSIKRMDKDIIISF